MVHDRLPHQAPPARLGVSYSVVSAVLVVAATVAVLAIPSLLERAERRKAFGAIEYLEDVRRAQEGYRRVHGVYAGDLRQLDVTRPEPTYFTVDGVVAGSSNRFNDSWMLTLTRAGADNGFGSYTLTFDETGFRRQLSSIPSELSKPSSRSLRFRW